MWLGAGSRLASHPGVRSHVQPAVPSELAGCCPNCSSCCMATKLRVAFAYRTSLCTPGAGHSCAHAAAGN